GLPGMGDVSEVAGFERAVDLLDRHTGRDEAHAEEVGKGRVIRRIERREHPLRGQRDGVSGVGRRLEREQAKRIMAEYMVEVLSQREVGPVIANADELDTVAPIRRPGSGEAGFEELYSFVLSAKT